MNPARKYHLIDRYEEMRTEVDFYIKYVFPAFHELDDLGVLIRYFKIVFRDCNSDRETLIAILESNDLRISDDEFKYILSVIEGFLIWFRENY
jgi:hypothetical protein